MPLAEVHRPHRHVDPHRPARQDHGAAARAARMARASCSSSAPRGARITTSPTTISTTAAAADLFTGRAAGVGGSSSHDGGEGRARAHRCRQSQKPVPCETAPVVDLAAGRPVSPSHLRDPRTRRVALGDDPGLHLLRSAPTARGARRHLHPAREALIGGVQMGVPLDVSCHATPPPAEGSPISDGGRGQQEGVGRALTDDGSLLPITLSHFRRRRRTTGPPRAPASSDRPAGNGTGARAGGAGRSSLASSNWMFSKPKGVPRRAETPATRSSVPPEGRRSDTPCSSTCDPEAGSEALSGSVLVS